MVIGSLFFRRRVIPAFVIALAFVVPVLRAVAEDQTVKKDGTILSGQIVGVSDGQVMIQSTTSRGGIAKFPITITDIKSVSMVMPEAVAKVQSPDTPPAAVIAALEPQVKQFAGLPTTWVVDAMAQLACAYAEQGKADLASAIYKQIDTLYPGSNYQAQAVAGLAEMSLKAGKIDEALAAVKPIIEQANKDIAPSPADGAIYANAFLVYGQALEAQNKPRQALEAYLTVKTMFYQNPNLADQAVLLAKNLREHHPGLGIE